MAEEPDLHNFFDVNESLLLPVLNVDYNLTSRLLMTKTLTRDDIAELDEVENGKLKVRTLLKKLTTRGPKTPRRFVEAAAPQLTPELLEELRNDLEKITSQSQNLPVTDDDYTRKFALSDKKKDSAVQQPREDEERRTLQNKYSRLNKAIEELQQAKAKLKKKAKSLKSERDAIVVVEEKPQTEIQGTRTEASKSQNQVTETDASTATSTRYKYEAASFAVEDRLSSPAAAEPRAEGQRPRLTRAQRQQLKRAWNKYRERGVKDGDLAVHRNWGKALSGYCRGASEQVPDPPQLVPDAAAVYVGKDSDYWFIKYGCISGELLQLCEELLGPAVGRRLTLKWRGNKAEYLDKYGRLYYCELCFWFSSSVHCALARPEASLRQALDVTQLAGRSVYQEVDGRRRSLQSSTTVQQLWTHAQSPHLYVK